jgi:hypothetical protein
MQNIDKETNEFLMRMGPTFHMTLFHHHQITAKINEIEEPNDDELITFELSEGEYSIFYKKLKEFAQAEQAKFIQDNDTNPEGME